MTFVANTLRVGGTDTGGGYDSQQLVSYALNGKQGNRDDGESETFVVADTLTSGSHPGSNTPGRRREDNINLVAGPLGGGNDGVGRRSEDDPNLVTAFVSENQRAEVLETPYARQLTSGGGKPGQGYPMIREHASVRRLTPTECERLQALPDGWTQLGDTPDSRRYAALGDAVTATVAEWIGRRLMEAEWA